MRLPYTYIHAYYYSMYTSVVTCVTHTFYTTLTYREDEPGLQNNRSQSLFFDLNGGEGSSPGFGTSLHRSISTDAIDLRWVLNYFKTSVCMYV